MLRYSNQDYIKRAKRIHNNYYSYDNTIYINSLSKIIITCPKHGDFLITAKEHINCRAVGCKKCSDERKKKTREQFIIEAKRIHNNYYSYDKVNYLKDNIKVVITCPKHGDFLQTPNSHLQFHGCPKCKSDKLIKRHKLNINEFIEKAKHVHGDRYDYSLVDYKNMYSKVKIICKKHGIFEQSPSKHINYKQGCPKCSLSKGELVIEQYLKEHNIKYISQYKFKDCKGNKRSLSFDFYLPDYNTCIEYDGELHYKTFRNKKRKNDIIKLERIKKYDKIKTNYCNYNNIKLLRIPYWNKNNIKELISNFIFSFK